MFALLFRLARVVLVPLILFSLARSLARDLLNANGAGRGRGSAKNAGAGGGRRDARRPTGGFAGAPASPYETLGVPPGASDDEVRARYRELVSKYHPDRFAGMNDADFTRLAAEKFQRVRAAYEEIRRRRGF